MADDAESPGAADDFDGWAVNHGDFYPPGSRQDLEFRLSRNLVLAGRRWVTLIDGLVKARHGQSRARWQTMFSIAFAGGQVTTTALARRLGVQWPTLIRVLDQLEQEGLVTRRGNPDDGRSRWIELTPAGLEITRNIQTVLDPTRSEMLSGLSDEEVALGINLLGRILSGTRTWREVMNDADASAPEGPAE